MANSVDLPVKLHAALKSLQMYSSKHARTQGAIEELTTWLHRRLAERPILHISIAGGRLLMDGVPAEETPSTLALCREMGARRIGGVIIQRGVGAREINEFLEMLDQRPQNLLDLGGADTFLAGRHCPHLQVSCDSGPNGGQAAPAAPLHAAPAREPIQRLETPAHREAPRPAAAAAPLPLIPLEDSFLLETRVDLAIQTRLLQLDKPSCQALFKEVLDNSLLEVFFHAVEQILAALDSRDPVRNLEGILALEALATIEDPLSFPPGTLPLLTGGLLGCLFRQDATEVSELAVEALASLLASLGMDGDTASVRAFLDRMASLECTHGPKLLERVLGSPALGRLPMRVLFREGRGALENRVLPFFRECGESGARLLTRMLGEEPSRQRRNRILELLKALSPQSLPAIRACLATGPWYLTRNALNLLGDMADREAFEQAASCLEHSDLRVRRAAIRALWRLGGSRAEPSLLELLQRSDPETQVEILFGLGQIRSTVAIPAVGALASHAPEALRIKALETLGTIGNPSAIPTLAEYLKRQGRIFKTAESAEVRMAAAKALGAIATPEAAEALARAVEEAPKNGDQSALRNYLESLHLL